jgi:hypothetical protein
MKIVFKPKNPETHQHYELGEAKVTSTIKKGGALVAPPGKTAT